VKKICGENGRRRDGERETDREIDREEQTKST
jgi:hypothetical protein